MNEGEVQRQIAQMVQFIRQEAEEKASEIEVAADEEFNIEKLRMVEAEKQKIRKEFERKEQQVDVRKKIEYSTEVNAARMKILQAREEAVQAVRQAAMERLLSIGNPSSSSYKQILQKLILQGMIKLEEDAIVVQCREADKGVVQDSIYQATQMYSQRFKDTKAPHVTLDTKSFLEPSPHCSGGVKMLALEGRIVCNNTLDARLAIAYEQNLPMLRKRMFGSGE